MRPERLGDLRLWVQAWWRARRADRQRLGLIAGNGQFPLLVAEAARAQGQQVFAIAIEG